MAKEPVPGRVKTRLCPPCTAVQAAELAEAALADTLEAVARCGATRRLLALDGLPGPWLPAGFEVFPQHGAGLARRLVAAWDRAGGPGIQIGMDTPQVTAVLLDDCLHRLVEQDRTAALGLALDGGWWALGLRRPDPAVFLGVPMSTPWTGPAQERRLRELGHDPVRLPRLRDVDCVDDAVAVADEAPMTRFASACRRTLAAV
jgi:glycosyltransferase A (GT-A) superfamily protein (DUF2064 family)